MISKYLAGKIKKEFERKHYKIFGHSGVQICEWTKKSIRGTDVCYKEKFYGIDCHRCMQFSPAVAHCNLNCIFCWRPNELMYREIEGKTDEPEEIIENLIELRKKLLSGFGGNESVDKRKFTESLNPNHFAVSLSGEPTLYPKIIEMIDYLSKKAKSVFLVTNGTKPEILEKLKPRKNFQLYISINAPNEKLFREICKPSNRKEWSFFNRSLENMSDFKGRKVARLTLIRNYNDNFIDEYVKLIEKYNPDFIEVKSFISLGYSKKRLGDEHMLKFSEIKKFSENISKKIDYEIINMKQNSRIVLLKNKSTIFKYFK
ncbi:MAG: 4-demethylwyosine synthase TYW1 [Candidatus Aenigmarchaeota archaeon ex4484_56]|nr:MAG: 4-demethylwyosine synthase TYW1 [Candidatus Aenigmarchaeota archaeon ex4484_56]